MADAKAVSALYDDDIVLRSEQQAEVIRGLGRTRRYLPDGFDVENVAEEIESLGRSELASVQSFLQLILLHLIKLAEEPRSDSIRHWRAEIVGVHGDLMRRYAPSMHRRIEVERLWRQACEQAVLATGEAGGEELHPPEECPLALDAFLGERIDVFALTERVERAIRQGDA